MIVADRIKAPKAMHCQGDASGRNGANNKIVLTEVTKTIKGKLVLDNITLLLEQGAVYGFSGVNGSGKTMLFRAISGLIRIDSGEITVFGDRIGKDVSFPSNLGVIIESVGLWDDYTGMKNLQLLASIKNVIDDEGIRNAIRRVGLNPDDNRNYKKYSLGMKQRLGIAQAIMECPSLLILDEPTNALDDQGKQLIRDIVIEEKQRGCTVLIASHDHNELDYLCDKQFTMFEGKLSEG